MKNNSSIRLITLLKLLSDQFEPGERRRIEARVREDSVAIARLQKLRAAHGRGWSLQLDRGGVDSTDTEFAVQQIAAFFDGTLSAEETLAFERDCWESPALLHDVTELFRSELQSNSLRSDDSKILEVTSPERRLRKRLVGLFPQESSVRPKINGVETAVNAATRQPSRPLDSQDGSISDERVVVVPRNLSKKPGKHARFSISTKFVIAIAVSVAIVASSIIIANWDAFNGPPSVVVESPNESEFQGEFDQTPKVVGTDVTSHVEDTPDSRQPDRIVDLANPNELQRNVDRDVPNLDGPGMPAVRSPDGLAENVDPKTPSQPESVDKDELVPAALRMRLAWSWDRVEGLVAVRATDSTVWSGALAEYDSSPDKRHENERVDVGRLVGLECKVLPLSWAQASLKGLGKWTIPENTDFFVASRMGQPDSQSLNRNQYSPQTVGAIGVKIKLKSGRLAIADANVDSVVLIETTTANWRIQITDPASVVIVEQGSTSRVIVQKGSAKVNGKELKARQQLVWGRDRRLEQTVNRDTVKWLRKPEHKFPSKQFSTQWLACRDLFADLSRPDAIATEDKPFLRAAFATIDPPGRAALYLANVIPEVRAEGIHWLLAYGQDQQRLRKLSDELATELAMPGLKVTLPRLVAAIQRKRWPPEADVDLLISGLQNRNAKVRRLSHGFLVHLFGAHVDYDSESNVATRNLQARKWHVAVNRLYRRKENANQR